MADKGLKQAYTPARPDPWIQRKCCVGILLALIVWSFYVVVGRACTPLIQRRSSSGLSRSTGIGILIAFVILFLLFSWSYLKMICTGPGFAVKTVPRCPSPEMQAQPPVDSQADADQAGQDPDPSTLAPVGNLISQALHQAMSRTESSDTLAQDSHPPVKEGRRDWREVQRPVPQIDPGPRRCRFCNLNKPDRTHHCRHCGTCVLQFDHHCIWVGQCVGWANHKFFIIFTFWGSVYCFFILGFLIACLTRDSSVDGQIIGLIAVSGLFGIFSWSMLLTHIHLVVTGRSTVESFKGTAQEEQEAAVLQMEYGHLWHNQEKRKVKRKWKEEWGGVPVDARWRWGSASELWKEKMGEGWIGWFCKSNC